MHPRPCDVCYMNDQGEIICDSSGGPPVVPKRDARAAIEDAFGSLSDARFNLLCQLAEQIKDSPLDDACIATRTDDTVQSVYHLLQTTPPLMLLFRYSTLPGQIMAQYYLHVNNYQQALMALEHWSSPKPPC